MAEENDENQGGTGDTGTGSPPPGPTVSGGGDTGTGSPPPGPTPTGG